MKKIGLFISILVFITGTTSFGLTEKPDCDCIDGELINPCFVLTSKFTYESTCYRTRCKASTSCKPFSMEDPDTGKVVTINGTPSNYVISCSDVSCKGKIPPKVD